MQIEVSELGGARGQILEDRPGAAVYFSAHKHGGLLLKFSPEWRDQCLLGRPIMTCISTSTLI